MGRARVRKAARQSIVRGDRPRFHLVLDRGEVVEMPWLEFGGDRTAAVVEAARRAVAAELDVRPDEIELEWVEGDAIDGGPAGSWGGLRGSNP
jgi:hypothetical protein